MSQYLRSMDRSDLGEFTTESELIAFKQAVVKYAKLHDVTEREAGEAIFADGGDWLARAQEIIDAE